MADKRFNKSIYLKKLPVRAHHIASHFTSSMFPASSVLLTLFFMTGAIRFELAAFYCIVFGTLAGPVVYGSGVFDWKTRFQGRRTRIFDHKIFFGLMFLSLSLVIIISRIVWPDVILASATLKWVYLSLVYAVTACSLYLGYLGGKFI